MNIDNEQLFHDLEQRHVSLRKEHEATCAERDSFKYKSNALQITVNDLRDQLLSSERKIADIAQENKQRDSQLKELSTSQDELNDRYRRRSEEIDRLREDLKSQATEMLSLQCKLKDSQVVLSETQSKYLPTEFELTRVKHEKEQLESKVLYLEEELRKKSKEERDLRGDFGVKIHDSESRLQISNASVEDAQRQLAALKDQLAAQQEKTDAYLAKLNVAEASVVSQQSSFGQEVEGLKRLVELYKRYFEEATAKVEEMESSHHAQREAQTAKLVKLKETVSAQFESREQEFAQERAASAAKLADLETELRTLQQQHQQVLETQQKSSSVQVIGGAEPSFEDFDGVGITAMYDRVVAAERELFAERDKRKEVELYMAQILKDIEAKAPVIASQRRDYHRIVEAHTRLSQKMDQLVTENSELREAYKNLQLRSQQAVDECNALERHNADLCAQLQHVLKQSMGQSLGNGPAQHESSGKGANAGEVITDYLLTFNDVAELQLRNAQLLKVVRKLSQEQESALTAADRVSDSTGSKTASKEVSEALKAALVELNNMREARKRTEDMVAGLVQQRDMYRAIAEEGESVVDAVSRATPTKSPARNSSALTLLSSPGPDQSRAAELQLQLAQSEDERRRLQDRMSRMEEAEKLLHESLDKMRAEGSAVRMELAQATSEARFQRERAERLDNSLKVSQLENASALQRRLDIEKTLVDLQREVRVRDDKVADTNEQLRAALEVQRRAEIEVEVAKASEARVVTLLSEAREEVKRHASLAEYLHRIEAGLQSKAEEEKETVVRERDALARSYEALRKQVDERGLIEDQRLRCLEDDLRTAKTQLDEKVGEVTNITSELIREQCTAKSAQERSSLLEKQLSIAHERLNSAQGAQILDSISTSDAAAKELQFERAAAEIESLKAQLVASDEHAEQFRRISSANEAALKELRAKTQEIRAAAEAEASKFREERDAAMGELAAHRSSAVGLMTEVEEAREKLRVLSAEKNESCRQLQEQVDLAKQESSQLQTQLELLKMDAVKFQTAAKSAYANYERELQMHAQAEKELRQRDSELDAVKESLAVALQQSAALSASSIHKEHALEEERNNFRSSEAQLREQLEGLQRTNDLLHAQVQSFGVQIDRLHEARLVAVTEPISGASGVDVSTGATSGDGQQLVQIGAEELAELRKSNGEIREVLRFLKKEKDMLAARLSVAETEGARHQSDLHLANRALDEARAELKRELDRRVVVRSEEDFSRLMTEVTQLNLVRESNAHLRGENEELSRRIGALTAELAELKTAKLPLEEAVRRAQADKESMELINDELKNDVGYWRDRLQKLVSRYNDVDPEEHRLLKAQLEEVQAALETQKVSAAAELQAKTAELASKSEELQAVTGRFDVSEAMLNKLRDNMRILKNREEAKKASLKEANELLASREQEHSAVSQQLVLSKSQVAELTAALAAAQASLVSTQSALAAANSAAASGSTAQITAHDESLSRSTSVAAAASEPADTVAAARTPATANKKRDRATQEAETVAVEAPPATDNAPVEDARTASETAALAKKTALRENMRMKMAKQKAAQEAAAAAAAAVADQSASVPVVAAPTPAAKKQKVVAAVVTEVVASSDETAPAAPESESAMDTGAEESAPVAASAAQDIEVEPVAADIVDTPVAVEEPVVSTTASTLSPAAAPFKAGTTNPFSKAKPATSGPFSPAQPAAVPAAALEEQDVSPVVEADLSTQPPAEEEAKIAEKIVSAPPKVSLFGGGPFSSKAPTPFGFGNLPNNSGTGFGGFGTTAVTQSIFGKPASAGDASKLFGSKPATPLFGMFGGAANKPFGNAAGASGAPVFGQTNSLFGTPAAPVLPDSSSGAVALNEEVVATPPAVEAPLSAQSSLLVDLETKKAQRAARFSAGGGGAQVDGAKPVAQQQKKLSKGAIANAAMKSKQQQQPPAAVVLKAQEPSSVPDTSASVDAEEQQEEPLEGDSVAQDEA